MRNEHNNRVLGLDIGIASVGWGIIDMENGSVVDAGVRLFSEVDAEENEKRRTHRGARRLLRRRAYRTQRMRHLLKKHGYLESDDTTPKTTTQTPYDIRVKGLREQLTKEEFAIALLHITKRRGIDNVDIVTSDKKEEEDLLKTKDVLAKNHRLLQEGKFVCEIQQERLRTEGKTRGLANRFNTKDYVAEARALMERQGAPEKFVRAALKIIQSRRAYYDGPGSKHAPTPYGQYFYDEDGNLQHLGMIDKMRGRCGLFPDKFRAPRMCLSAEIFNLFNQLNNITYDGDKKVTPEQKWEIINTIVIPKGGITPKQLAKALGTSLDNINSLPVDKSDKPYLLYSTKHKNHAMSIRALRTALKKAGLDDALLMGLVSDNHKQLINEKRGKLIDDIVEILTTEKSIPRRVRKMRELNDAALDEAHIAALSTISTFTGTHAFSFEALRAMIPDLWQTQQNQMQIIAASGLAHKHTPTHGTRIPFYDDDITSPVARRAHREAVKVINAARKKYGEFASIVVEMARDKNSQEQKAYETKRQKYHEQSRAHARETIGNRKEHITAQDIIRLRLYEQQEGKCIYTGEEFSSLDDVVHNRNVEVDHIIPRSVSFDDSLANKVLCTKTANQQKGQRTPYQWLKSGNGPRSYEAFKAHVLALKNIPRKKREYLLFERDITAHDVRKQFINRNLVDTRYAARVLLNTVQGYMRANNIPTTVHTVRGSVTHMFRVHAQIPKSREDSHAHHAIDALIVAAIKKMDIMDHALAVYARKDSEGNTGVYSRATGELITERTEEDYFPQHFLDFVKTLRDTAPGRIRYSWKVDRKPNRQITDQTLYGVREIDGVKHKIGKYNDIYGKDGELVAKLFRDGKAEKQLLMAKHDPYTFTLLAKIVQEYPDEKNPFAAYRDREKGEDGTGKDLPIRKCNKRGEQTGPIITSLRKDTGKLGIHNDISHKYNAPRGTVVQTSLNPYRVDIYRTPQGTYKFLRLTYMHLTPVQSDEQKRHGIPPQHYRVDTERYAQEKAARGITDEDKFLFSLHKNELFGFVQDGKEECIVRFNGVYDYNANTIEYKEEAFNAEGRLRLAIGRKITKLRKYATDVLGHRYRIRSEDCTMTISVL